MANSDEFQNENQDKKKVVIPDNTNLNDGKFASEDQNKTDPKSENVNSKKDSIADDNTVEQPHETTSPPSSTSFEEGFAKLLSDVQREQEEGLLNGSLIENPSHVSRDAPANEKTPEDIISPMETASHVTQDGSENKEVLVDEDASHVSRDIDLNLVYPKHVFEDLPPILKKPFEEVVTKKQQQDLALTVLLAVLSGMLPNYFTKYDGTSISPNLFLSIVAPFGEGKGYIRFIKRILQKAHARKLHEADDDKKRFLDQMAAIESGESTMKKSEVEKPKLFRLLIPANNSKTGMIDLISQNRGHGTIFETEIDTMVESIKMDYGNFSDLLRNAFQNEGHSLHRRTNNESIEIESLFLTVILSGTLGQLFTLVPRIENGLFSRFAYFSMTQDQNFHDVFDDEKLKLENYFDNYALFFDDIHKALEERCSPVFFSFQVKQRKIFQKFFQTMKTELRENVDPAFGGVVHRLAVMCCRIAQILSFYRTVIDTNIPDTIVCNDLDFNTALEIINVLKRHTLKVFYEMPEDAQKNSQPREKEDPKLVKKAKELYTEGMSYRKIAKFLLGASTKQQTIYRWVNDL